MRYPKKMYGRARSIDINNHNIVHLDGPQGRAVCFDRGTSLPTLKKSLKYNVLLCLYYKYCFENFLNDSIIRPVQRQCQEHYRYKYCLYYKYCWIFHSSISYIGMFFNAYLILYTHLTHCKDIF